MNRRDFIKTIREATGETYLIGCNTFSHLAAGLFELNRIGDDTSGKEWDRTRKMGVNTLDWMEDAFPKKWKLNGKDENFNWD